ncbi:NO-inducible flavohemoprotein [Halalkalibacterium halodurans]|uniref:Flavohemoprotein n=1 Tax=Halalkalibacterium halodurans TaxID=86665 RepID=A0A0M0KM05_ALKHA|nr:NO-inducible flavohemoprotein [Halalkalibacterium halodurans]TES52792.1 NO-inducible flavohemoprotein [Halalkalibacterium halodurans]TPE70716.1 NO-inducible flavohemoprotein [Halalkalibacterium halodurans]
MSTATLSQETKQIVKATVPILAEHGEAITKHFYKRMFSHHPELLNIFNQTHQKQGRQPQALANSIYAAAEHIDNLEAILPVVSRIAHKHRSLNIKPEQYPIVGENLLAAMREVLGDAASDDVLEAWREAYELIADVFIQVEKKMYEEASQAPGGWREFRSFVVEKKQRESATITSFYLKPEDGKALASYKPGQYITVKVTIPGQEHTHMRQYSLSDAPEKGYYRITVKREEGDGDLPPGIVSNYLHQHIHEGDVLEITAPAGDFTLQEEGERPIVFISGGVGVTPLMSMFNTLMQRGVKREVIFIHAAINGFYHAMHDHLAKTASQQENVHYAVCYERPTPGDRMNPFMKKEGFIDESFLRSILHDREADFYFCGPVPFMKTIAQILKDWDVPEQQVHYEFFGPAGTLASS